MNEFNAADQRSTATKVTVLEFSRKLAILNWQRSIFNTAHRDRVFHGRFLSFSLDIDLYSGFGLFLQLQMRLIIVCDWRRQFCCYSSVSQGRVMSQILLPSYLIGGGFISSMKSLGLLLRMSWNYPVPTSRKRFLFISETQKDDPFVLSGFSWSLPTFMPIWLLRHEDIFFRLSRKRTKGRIVMQQYGSNSNHWREWLRTVREFQEVTGLSAHRLDGPWHIRPSLPFLWVWEYQMGVYGGTDLSKHLFEADTVAISLHCDIVITWSIFRFADFVAWEFLVRLRSSRLAFEMINVSIFSLFCWNHNQQITLCPAQAGKRACATYAWLLMDYTLGP
jgi:hypothetical protein